MRVQGEIGSTGILLLLACGGRNAVVELIALENATINYSTVQNWYSGNGLGKGGVYNFVTKRGLCAGSQ
jgi:Fe-S cluster assembly scaffold protein SufB